MDKTVYWIDVKNMMYEIIYYGYFLDIARKPGNIRSFVTASILSKYNWLKHRDFPWGWGGELLSNQQKYGKSKWATNEVKKKMLCEV